MSAGVDLYNYVRSLQPDIIINNRVGKARAGMDGMDKGGRARRRLRHARAGNPAPPASAPAWIGNRA